MCSLRERVVMRGPLLLPLAPRSGERVPRTEGPRRERGASHDASPGSPALCARHPLPPPSSPRAEKGGEGAEDRGPEGGEGRFTRALSRLAVFDGSPPSPASGR